MFSSLKVMALAGLLPLLAVGATTPTTPMLGPGAVKAMYEKLFHAMDNGDAKGLAAFFRPHQNYPSRMFANRFQGESLDIQGNAKIRKVLESWMVERKTRGGKYKTRILSIDAQCHSPGLSYANLVFETSHTGGKKDTLRKYWLSSLLNYQKGVWGVFHWHLSLAAQISPRAELPKGKGAPKK